MYFSSIEPFSTKLKLNLTQQKMNTSLDHDHIVTYSQVAFLANMTSKIKMGLQELNSSQIELERMIITYKLILKSVSDMLLDKYERGEIISDRLVQIVREELQKRKAESYSSKDKAGKPMTVAAKKLADASKKFEENSTRLNNQLNLKNTRDSINNIVNMINESGIFDVYTFALQYEHNVQQELKSNTDMKRYILNYQLNPTVKDRETLIKIIESLENYEEHLRNEKLKDLVDIEELYSTTLKKHSENNCSQEHKHIVNAISTSSLTELVNMWSEADLMNIQKVLMGPIVVPQKTLTKITRVIVNLSQLQKRLFLFSRSSYCMLQIKAMLVNIWRLFNTLDTKLIENWQLSETLFEIEAQCNLSFLLSSYILCLEQYKIYNNLKNEYRRKLQYLNERKIAGYFELDNYMTIKYGKVWSEIRNQFFAMDIISLKFIQYIREVNELSDILISISSNRAMNRKPTIDASAELAVYLLQEPTHTFVPNASGVAFFELHSDSVKGNVKNSFNTLQKLFDEQKSSLPSQFHEELAALINIEEKAINGEKLQMDTKVSNKIGDAVIHSQLSDHSIRFNLRKDLQAFILQILFSTSIERELSRDLRTKNSIDILLRFLAYEYERIKLLRFVIENNLYLIPDTVFLIGEYVLVKEFVLMRPVDRYKQFLSKYYQCHYDCSRWKSQEDIEKYEKLVSVCAKKLLKTSKKYEKLPRKNRKMYRNMRRIGIFILENGLKIAEQEIDMLHTDYISLVLDIFYQLSHSENVSTREQTRAFLIEHRSHFLHGHFVQLMS